MIMRIAAGRSTTLRSSVTLYRVVMSPVYSGDQLLFRRTCEHEFHMNSQTGGNDQWQGERNFNIAPGVMRLAIVDKMKE